MHRFLQHHMGCWMRRCRKKLHCNFSSQYYCLCVASNVKNYETFLSAIILRFHFVLLHYMRDTSLLWISNHIHLDFECIRFFLSIFGNQPFEIRVFFQFCMQFFIELIFSFDFVFVIVYFTVG